MSVHWGGRGAGHVSRWGEGVYPLVFNFIPAALDTRIAFTRASDGTFVGSNGLIQTAAIDAARFTHSPTALTLQGLLIEPQSTNLLTYSEQINNAAWTKATGTISVDATVAPDGISSADNYIQNNGTTGELIRTAAVTVTANSEFTISGFFLAVNGTPAVSLYSTAGGNGFRVVVNLSTGAVLFAQNIGTGTYVRNTVESFGNGWYRVSATGRLATGATAGQWRMAMVNLAGANVTGDGSQGIAVWGAQFEAASFVTSYMPTAASSVIRSADSAAFTIPSGVSKLRYVFDNGTVQDVAVAAGAYTIPTNLNRPIIKAILGLAY
jgi:hypothetical protein